MTLKIEAGKYYRTRDGKKVGPIRWNGGTDWNGYCAAADCAWGFHESGRFGVMTGKVDGPHRTAYERQRDLISEWRETDLTTITTPFGLLDEETQQALRDHGGPYEVFAQCGNFWRWQTGGNLSIETHQALAWRVKPKPETTEYVLYWEPDANASLSKFNSDTHKIIITMEGDKLTGIRAEALE